MKKTFLTGLVTLLPLAVTVWLVRFLVNLLTNPFLGLILPWLKIAPWFRDLNGKTLEAISQIFILIFLFIFILFLGFVGRRFFFHQLLQIGDRMLKNIPLVNKVYKTSKEIINSLFSSQSTSFTQVVMLAFPYPGAYCLGIITSQAPEEGKLSVFIPTAPNPTTGFLVMAFQRDLIYLDMKSEEAIKYVVSCGVIQPKRPA